MAIDTLSPDSAAVLESRPRRPLMKMPSSDFDILQNMLRPLFPSTVCVQNIYPLKSRIHPLRWLTLSNGEHLVLKYFPRPSTRLLRQEQYSLETEARALALLLQTANPCIPRVFYYDPHGYVLGSPFLLRQYVRGSTLREMSAILTVEEREGVDRHLGFLANTIAQHVASSFGTLKKVAYGLGYRTWREAFISLFESLLRDAEDTFINLPYSEIRYELGRLAQVLNEVTVPRLVIVDFGCPSHVLLDPKSKQMTGIINFGSALWGDVLMAELFHCPSESVLEGFGTAPAPSQSKDMRLLL